MELKSPKLIKDAERQRVRVAPRSGEEIRRLVESLTKASPQTIETYKGFLTKR